MLSKAVEPREYDLLPYPEDEEEDENLLCNLVIRMDDRRTHGTSVVGSKQPLVFELRARGSHAKEA